MTSRADTARAALARAGDTVSQRDVPANWPNRDRSLVTVAGGRRWHVQDAGRGPGLLLLHGTGASTHSWRDLLPKLAGQFRVIAPDLPGHARTERRAGERLSLEAMSGALGALLASIGFRPDFVVGHSAGAAIGLRMALDGTIVPQASIGLNAALLPYGGAWQPVIAPLARLCASTSLVPKFLSSAARDPASVRRMLESTGSTVDLDGLATYQSLMQSEAHVAAVLSMMANWNLERFLDDLPRLDGRLHLVTARDDLAVKPVQAEKLRRLVPFADVVPVRGGHLAHEEYPDEIAALIARLCLAGTASDETNSGVKQRFS